MRHWDVARCFSSQGRGSAIGAATIFVCTMERANSLANRWLEEGQLSKLCCVVVDELHMVRGVVSWQSSRTAMRTHRRRVCCIVVFSPHRTCQQVGDDERGYLLELLLTKLRYCNDKQAGRVGRTSQGSPEGTTVEDAAELEGLQTSACNGCCWWSLHACVGRVDDGHDMCMVNVHAPDTQIVGMSATLGNGEQVARWLDAAYYCSTFRPITLQQWVAVRWCGSGVRACAHYTLLVQLHSVWSRHKRRIAALCWSKCLTRVRVRTFLTPSRGGQTTRTCWAC